MQTRKPVSIRLLLLIRVRCEWLALVDSLQSVADAKGWDTRNSSRDIRIRRNAYRQLRLRQSEFIKLALMVPKVKDPYRYVERLFERLDARDEESKKYGMTAEDWLPLSLWT